MFGEDGGRQRGGGLGAVLGRRWGCLRGHCCDAGRGERRQQQGCEMEGMGNYWFPGPVVGRQVGGAYGG